MLLGDHAYRVALKIREGCRRKWACHPTQFNFFLSISRDNIRVLMGRNEIMGDTGFWGPVVTDAHTIF